MKDSDFDELDKAVNSLMTSLPKAPPASSSLTEENTLNISPSENKVESPVADALEKAEPAKEQKEEVVAATTAALSAPAASTPPKRGGRFMDVVHPSSDMKKVTSVPPRPVSRQGATIEPKAPTTPEAAAPTPTPPVSTPSVDVTPDTSAAEEIESTQGWPDPIEMTDFKDPVVPVPQEEEWSATPSTETPEAGPESEPAPLTSPFLPDTKVEKRPLGSAAAPVANDNTDMVDELTPEPREDKTVDDPDDQLPAMPGDVPLQLPEELQGDLMSVEADTHMGMPKTEQTHPSDEKLIESGLPEEPATKPTTVVSNGPVSIPQQYKEEPSTGDQKNAGIYDTDTFHTPLEHPAKKKSSWMLVIWIIAILLAGAGAGAALFFSGLIG